MNSLMLAAMSWTPGFRGILTVVVAVLILCGSIFLILATNNGARLGFLLALTGFCGWMFVMGIIWSLYGIGWKGSSPTWKVVDVVRSEPGSGEVVSSLAEAESLPLPDELPDPVELRDASEAFEEAYPSTQRDPKLGDLVGVPGEGEELLVKLNEQVAPWRVLPTSNKYTGETQAFVSSALGPEGANVFASASDYVVLDSYLIGGKKGRTDDSILGRVKWKIGSIFDQRPPDFYAAVQLQEVIPQETKPGAAPPTPVPNEDAPIVTVVLKRIDGHHLRRNAIGMTILMGAVTAVLCSMLHRRDKLAQAQRAATAGAS
ncbi:hypothetical protein ACE2AJ_08660 [Aquihabitans daechungensis]|uniref:hypothetical protein n=1 Tax=Aquihabitans daechungensis TaxID=1052257 RepID=UPI003BA34B67